MAVGFRHDCASTYFDRASFLALGIFVVYLLAPLFVDPPLVLCQLGTAGQAPQPSDSVSSIRFSCAS